MPVVKWLQNVFEGKKKASAERRIYKEIDEQLSFAVSESLTLGIEFELGLLCAKTLLPAHEGPTIIDALNSPQIKKELFDHMVEVTSNIGYTVNETEGQMKSELARLTALCAERGFLLTGTGRPPSIKLADTIRVKDKRYERLHDERQVLNERFGTLGMHIHLGMSSAEQCIRYNSFFLHLLPHLIALSASSPFEDGVNTGLASIRPTIAESLPIAGVPYPFRDWREYAHLCRAMYKAGSIQNLKDLWWDLRPCPHYGTLEIRVCDQTATLGESMAIVAFVHLLAHWFQEHQGWLDEMPRPNAWRLRENKWRSMRYGLDANLVIDNQGETRPLCEDIRLWLDRLKPFIEKLGYEKHTEMLETIMTRGNSAKRQQLLWEATHSLADVAMFNCAEFEAQTPLWDKLDAMISNLAENKTVSKAAQ